ncbi:MAG TPA: SRPBCC family protein [Acidobacteriaceae bacterium]
MPYSFRSEQWLPYPVEAVFAFFADPENLPALMPPWQRVRIEKLTLVPPRGDAAHLSAKAAGAGSRIVLSMRAIPLVPIRVRWDAEIIEFEPNRHFTDRQVRGPFAFWQHTHHVRALDRNGPGVTVVTDEVNYDLPLWIFGHMAHALFLHRQIEKVFAFRRERIIDALARATSTQPAASPQDTRAS